MNNEANVNVLEASEESYCSDGRFTAVFANARELKVLIDRLNDIAGLKVEELLGSLPSEPAACVDSKQTSPPAWIDKVLHEQDESLRLINSALDLLERV